MEIRVKLRNGDEYTLDYVESDAARMFERLTTSAIEAVYPQGWLPVRPAKGDARAVIRGREIVDIRLVDENSAAPQD